MKKVDSRISVILVFVVGLFVVFEGLAFGVPDICNYSPQRYGAGMQNSDVLQDRRGVYYMANNYGLLEFDGQSWRLNHISNGTKVRSLALGLDGKVFVGAQDQFGYFESNAQGQMKYFSISDQEGLSQSSGDIWNTHVVNGLVYFSSSEKLYLYDGSSVQVLLETPNLGFCFKVKNKLYVQVKGQGIGIVDGDRVVMLLNSQRVAGLKITGITQIASEMLLIATEKNGLWVYDGYNFTRWDAEVNSYLDQKQVICIRRLSTDEIALGTANNGLYIISMTGKVKMHLDKEKGLANRVINNIFEDYYGFLWVCQNNGFSRIDYSSPFTYINEVSGVQGAGYCSFQYGEHQFYLGTNNGVYRCEGDQPCDRIRGTEGQAYSMQRLNNFIAVGHTDGAVFLQEDQVLRSLNADGSWKFASPDLKERWVIEGGYNGFYRYEIDGDRIHFLGKVSGFDESSRVFEAAGDHVYWMTHGYKGAYKVRFSQNYDSVVSADYYGVEQGFQTNQLINVFRVNEALVFCTGSGVYRYDENADRFELHPEFTELFGKQVHIRELTEDPYGHVYYSTVYETGVLKKNRFGKYVKENRVFNKIHGLLNNDLEDIQAFDFSHVILGAQDGFVHYNSNKSTKLLDPIRTLIRRVELTSMDSVLTFGNDVGLVGQEEEQGKVSLISYHHNDIRFEYSTTFFDDRHLAVYSYQLVGFDEDWSAWSLDPKKDYTNLPEGNYTFKVKSKNVYETESPEAVYHFEINTPWHRTPIAYASYFLVCSSFIFLALVYQGNQYQKQKKDMESMQRQELHKKDSEFKQLSEASQEEIMRLKNEKLKLEVNNKNKELASTTMNLIDKNQLLTGLKNDLKIIIDHQGKGSIKSLRDMIKKIDRSISHDDDFTKRLRDTYDNLTPQEVKLSNYLRMNLSSKEIAQLMNITTRGVEIARYRLRKKLGLSREDNLTDFIGRF